MEKLPIKILYLDDEVENLVGFKANFRRYYEIHTALTVKEALTILAKQEIHLIMIDQGMPEISGLEFLQLINEDFPHTMRVLVTAHINHEDFLDIAIGSANVYRCISKPWTENDMRIAIEDAFKIYCFKKEKEQELLVFKSDLSNSLKAPVANLEGLLALARIEIKDEYALNSYFEYMTKSVEALKRELTISLESRIVESKCI